MDKVLKSGYTSYQRMGITNYYQEVTDNIGNMIAASFASVFFSTFDESLFIIGENQSVLISDLVSGTVTFKNDLNQTIPTPSDAQIRIVPERFQNDTDGYKGLRCTIDPAGTFGTNCYTDANESAIREAFNDANETFQVVVYKKHIDPDQIRWDCGEDVYRYIGDNEPPSSWAEITVLPSDYEDRSTESCGDEAPPYFLKKTGQTLSYDENGTEITDGSLKDDGFYQTGLDVNYTRDDSKEIVTDHVTALMWQDDENVSVVTKPWLTQENYDACKNDGNETACFDTSGDTATTYCNELTLGGYSDWRLPTRVELQGIADYGHYDPAINPVFVNTNSNLYWSSTTLAYTNDFAWIVKFYNGYQNYCAKGNSYYSIRCVRAGQ